MAPVSGHERIQLIDVLRGFALFGILLVNFQGDSGTWIPTVDNLVAKALIAFVSQSFYPLFSFLFGLGFAVQLQRARARGTGVAWLYLRRMAVLLAIGTVHALFIWSGDILVRYALAGLLLIPLHRFSQRTVLAIGVVLFIAMLNGAAVRAQVAAWTGVDLTNQAALPNTIVTDAAAAQTTTASTYAESIATRFVSYSRQVTYYTWWLNWLLQDVFICFIAGLLVGRAGILHDPRRHTRGLVLAGTIALTASAIGLYANSSLDVAPGALKTSSLYAENFGITALYIICITLGFTFVGKFRRLMTVFASPGRMGLTNYLLQSTVMTWMSMDYGLGWEPATTAWVMLNIAFFFLLQVPLSRWWLNRYNFGPVEWLWRSLNYGALQPMRRHGLESISNRAFARTA